jgi:hypothetical protein
MTKIKKFNESITEEIVLTMDDVKSLTNNLGGRDNDPMKNYGWKEDKTLIIAPAAGQGQKSKEYNGKTIQVLDLFTSGNGDRYRYGSHLGYAVLIDDVPTYLVSIYEPHGFQLLPERNVLIVHGHEQITLLWLDNGEFNTTYTR